MKQTACRLVLLAVVAQLCGCGTLVSLSAQDYTAYGGVLRDFELIRSGGVMSVLAVVDLPLSFVFDTLLLPLTFSH